MAKKAKGFGFPTDPKKRKWMDKLKNENVFWRVPRNEQPEVKRDSVEEQEKRVAKIIGVDSEGDLLEVNAETLNIYAKYINENLEHPCYLTGMEDFSWEERYIFGYGSKKEYDELRKTRASYLDTYKLLELIPDCGAWSGIEVLVQRMEDGKKFDLPLSDLEATNRLSKNYQLLDDYSCWFVNYR